MELRNYNISLSVKCQGGRVMATYNGMKAAGAEHNPHGLKIGERVMLDLISRNRVRLVGGQEDTWYYMAQFDDVQLLNGGTVDRPLTRRSLIHRIKPFNPSK